jgi:hypothetical protein
MCIFKICIIYYFGKKNIYYKKCVVSICAYFVSPALTAGQTTHPYMAEYSAL